MISIKEEYSDHANRYTARHSGTALAGWIGARRLRNERAERRLRPELAGLVRRLPRAAWLGRPARRANRRRAAAGAAQAVRPGVYARATWRGMAAVLCGAPDRSGAVNRLSFER